jgi:hypothetical protein
MALKMNEFHGIDADHLARLKSAGIEDTDALMKIWSDKEKRAGLVEKTGVAEEHFLRYAAMARLGRVKGMGLEHLAILVAAGIDGPKRLFSNTPESLVKHLTEVAAEKKLTDPMPSLETVKQWFVKPEPQPGHANGKPATETKPSGDTNAKPNPEVVAN